MAGARDSYSVDGEFEFRHGQLLLSLKIVVSPSTEILGSRPTLKSTTISYFIISSLSPFRVILAASYSEGLVFKSRPRRPAMLIQVFVAFLSPSRRMPP